jgi:Plant transposon protein
MYLNTNGIEGMLGSLDCMHVGWKMVAWQGAFQGKEGVPTASYGYAGSTNDINIWDQSPLLKMMLDGTMALEIDFEFEIGGKVFNRCWFLADRIYSELACFAKTVDEPIGHGKSLYAVWQEVSCKDVERALVYCGVSL